MDNSKLNNKKGEISTISITSITSSMDDGQSGGMNSSSISLSPGSNSDARRLREREDAEEEEEGDKNAIRSKSSGKEEDEDDPLHTSSKNDHGRHATFATSSNDETVVPRNPDNVSSSPVSSHRTTRARSTSSNGGSTSGTATSTMRKNHHHSRSGAGDASSSLLANFDSGAAVGDYDMKKSASTAAFVQEIFEARYLNKERQRLIKGGGGAMMTTTSGGGAGVKMDRAYVDFRSRGIASSVISSATGAVLEGLDAIAEDDFWKCFEKTKVPAWNWNPFLWVNWAIGVTIRYTLLFPLRALTLLLGWLVFFTGMFLSVILLSRFKERKRAVERALISWLASIFILTWSGVIRYHGHVPKTPKSTNIVFVANHSSLIDVIVLMQMKIFSLVGQKHKGFVGLLQDHILGGLQCIWFDRAEMRDRAVVSRKLTQHARDPKRTPLLVFPEGTCVNNQHVIQFKKGAFELGVPVAPIAIRYNKLFVDPFWSSRDQSFPMHLFELMTSWCLICDVWFLEPTVRRDGESAEDFARRVRNAIAEKGGMKPVDWDGYLKHFSPSARLIQEKKSVYAELFKRMLEEERLAEASRMGDRLGGNNGTSQHDDDGGLEVAVGGEGEEDAFYFGSPSGNASPSPMLEANDDENGGIHRTHPLVGRQDTPGTTVREAATRVAAAARKDSISSGTGAGGRIIQGAASNTPIGVGPVALNSNRRGGVLLGSSKV